MNTIILSCTTLLDYVLLSMQSQRRRSCLFFLRVQSGDIVFNSLENFVPGRVSPRMSSHCYKKYAAFLPRK